MAELMMQFLVGCPLKHMTGPAKTIFDKKKVYLQTFQPSRSRPNFKKTMPAFLHEDIQQSQLFYIPLFLFEVTKVQ